MVDIRRENVTSEGVIRRQIITSNDGPRAERVKYTVLDGREIEMTLFFDISKGYFTFNCTLEGV